MRNTYRKYGALTAIMRFPVMIYVSVCILDVILITSITMMGRRTTPVNPIKTAAQPTSEPTQIVHPPQTETPKPAPTEKPSVKK